MKEAFAIFMSVKKLSFYLDQAEILHRSDHLPLKKFLQKNTLQLQGQQLGNVTGVFQHPV